jgi:hypothetical protein
LDGRWSDITHLVSPKGCEYIMKVITRMLIKSDNPLYADGKRNGVPGEVGVPAAYARIIQLRGSASARPGVKIAAIGNS